MKMKRYFPVLLSILSLMYGFSLYGIDLTNVKNEKNKVIDDSILQMQNPDWNERDKALQELKKFKDRDEVKLALIQALEQENQLSEKWWMEYHKNPEIPRREGSGEYYLDLLNTVASLKDRRSIRALITGCRSKAVEETIVSFGQESIDPMCDDLKTSCNPFIASCVQRVTGIMAQNNQLDENRRRKLQAAALERLGDRDSLMREEYVRILAVVADESSIPVLEKVASSDPHVFKRATDGQIQSPVREAARRAIEQIKARQSSNKNR